MLVTKADREAVPEIDQTYQCGEVDQFLLLEVLLCLQFRRRARD
jgi:hypothetical protein